MNFIQYKKKRFRESNKKTKFISAAMEEASKSRMSSKHGAIIVQKGKIVSRGHNHFVHQPHKGFSSKWSIHAEIDAINKIGDRKRLQNADMYVVRLCFNFETRKIYLKNSKPCHDCMKKLNKCIKKFGLRTVYFSTDD